MIDRASPTRKSITLDDGRRISYLEWTAPGPPTLLLIHGGYASGADWSEVSAAFAGAYHILAPDRRGCTYSHWHPQGDYSVEGNVADLS